MVAYFSCMSSIFSFTSVVVRLREMMMAVGLVLYTPFLADVSPHLKAKVGL